ncbi:MAG TPA: glycosyltransferase family 39 protein [Bryobacteraceae bacterium]|nr:glycosyltransferase family 39 protein [Bryobacteraceae bacterium]
MTSDSASKQRFLAGGMLAVVIIALGKLALHCLFNNRYGYFRDEFDYLACGDHPAWGYVDQPPVAPMLARLSRVLLGDSLRAMRFFPALCSSGLVVLAAMIARELGGRAFALVLTAVAILIAPIYLSDGSLFTTNFLEPLFWMGCAYSAILAVKRRDPRYWLWFGVIAGVGLEEKYSIAVMGFGLVIGLLLTEQRRALASRWMWLGGAAALLIFLPNVLWNAANQWPFLQLMHNIKTSGRDIPLGPFQFFAQQVLLIHPLTAPIWIIGLFALLLAPRFRPYRMLGWCYLAAFTIFVVLKGKNYYLAPIYPMLLAAGAVVIEGAIERRRQPWMKPAILGLLLATGALLAPIVVPVLPVDQFIAYMDRLPFAIPRSEQSHLAAILPQHYADQFGWEEIAAVVGQAWKRLGPDERAGCAVFGQNYGEAGAVDFFGRRYGLPPALSGHQTYYLWGPRGYSGNCLIVIGDRREVLERLFEEVTLAGTSDNPYALERNRPVYICRGSKFGTLAQLWPKVKLWD